MVTRWRLRILDRGSEQRCPPRAEDLPSGSRPNPMRFPIDTVLMHNERRHCIDARGRRLVLPSRR